MKKSVFFVLLFCAAGTLFFFLSGFAKQARVLEVQSPDKRLTLRVSIDDSLRYSVIYNGVEVVAPSRIGMTLEHTTLGARPVVKKTKRREANDKIMLPYGNYRQLDDHYRELEIQFSDSYALVLRAYNEGVAYRFNTQFSTPVKVLDEQAMFNVKGDPAVTYPETDVFTSWEVPYVEYRSLSGMPEKKRALTPVLFSYDSVRVIVAESDLMDYPGMYVEKTGGRIRGTWARYPKETVMGSWGNFVSVVKERSAYLAETAGTRAYPWRVIIPTNDDRTLLANDIIYKLARPSVLADVSWVKPGKAAWEWWHDALVADAGIPSGMGNRNTALYKHYIDFATASKLEYMMIDAGWSDIFDLSKVNPKVDIQEVIRYGNSKGVGVFLWCVAATLVKDADRYLGLMEQWGAVGIKVDFFDRDDQEAIRWFELIAKASAQHKLMVDFHGCSKPTGLERTYPNIVNYEAVRGAECAKWDYTANPRHHLLFPFIRMVAGPLDYTPGSMRNATKTVFKPIDPGLPFTQGTRCHELAMYVVYDEPFAMICDSPAEYRKYPDIMTYLSAVPASFDDTRVLQARLGQYAVMAKRKGRDWFVGAMTDWDARDLRVDFSFLPAGEEFTAEIYTDGQNANTDAMQYEHKTVRVNAGTNLNLTLAQGGGAVLYLRPVLQ